MKRDKKNDLILIVDDHPLLQIGVKGLVELVRPDAEFHFAGTKKDVLAKLSNKTFDLIVSDLNLPDSDSIEIIESIRNTTNSTLLVYSLKDELLMGPACFGIGVQGYVMKESSTHSFKEAVEVVLGGDIWCSSRLGAYLASGIGKKDISGVEKLTLREKQVFEGFGRGHSTKEIATMLDVKIKTIESHRDKIREKLNLDSTHDLIVMACEWL